MDPNRVPNNLQGLFRFCIEAGNDLPTNMEPIDPEKAAWLREAMNAMTVDLAAEMRTGIRILIENISTPTEESPDIIQRTLEDLTDVAEQRGMSDVFFKIKGLDLLTALFDYKPAYMETGLLLATLVQNDEKGQALAINNGFLTLALDRLTKSSNEPDALRGLIAAVSSLTRGNELGQKQFIADNGYTIIFDLLDKTTRTPEDQIKFKRFNLKTTFFISCICREIFDEQLAGLKSFNLSERIAEVALRLEPPSDNLIKALIMLLNGRVSTLLDPPPELTSDSVRVPVSKKTDEQLKIWLSSIEGKKDSCIEEEILTEFKEALAS